MVLAKKKYNLTSLNTEKISKIKNTKIEKKKSKSFLKFVLIKNAVIAIASAIASNPLSEYVVLRFQDVIGKEILLSVGEKAYDIYSIVSNAIIAEPTILALGITGISIIGDLVYITVKKVKEKSSKTK